MKQNFFNHLDGGWGDLIADTYKSNYDSIFYREIDNDGNTFINILLDEESMQSDIEIFEWKHVSYTEKYKDLVNENYNISIHTIINYDKNLKSVLFGFSILDIANENYSTYLSVLAIDNSSELHYHNLDNEIFINWKWCFNFIDKSCKILDEKFKNKKDPIPQLLIEKVKDKIKKELTNIY